MKIVQFLKALFRISPKLNQEKIKKQIEQYHKNPSKFHVKPNKFVPHTLAGASELAKGDFPDGQQHGCNISGAFILFGGWLKIYDHNNNNKECYCSFGGLGAGGWSDNGTLQPITNDGGQTYYSWDYIYNNTKSVMVESTPVSGQEILLFDGHSNMICSIDNLSPNAAFLGGGTAKWE